MIRALLALLLVAPVAAAQVVPPDAKRLTDVACVLTGCATSGSGDIESVTITGTAPVTVTGSPCASGACVLAVSLTNMAIGTNLQAWDADLDGLAGLGNGLPYRASGTWGASAPATGVVPYMSAAGLVDTPLYRVDANTLAQTNSTTAQTLRVFKSNDGAAGAVGTNYGYGDVTSDANGTVLRSRRGGTVTGNNISIDTPASGFISFQANGVQHSYISSAGRFNIAGLDSSAAVSPGTSESFDLGTASVLWRHLYLSRSIQGGVSKALTEGVATSFIRIAIPSGSSRGASFDYMVRADDGTDFQSLMGEVWISGANKAGTITVGTIAERQSTCACSAGTLTATVTVVDAGSGNMDVKIDATSSLTQTTLAAIGRARLPLTATVSFP